MFITSQGLYKEKEMLSVELGALKEIIAITKTGNAGTSLKRYHPLMQTLLHSKQHPTHD